MDSNDIKRPSKRVRTKYFTDYRDSFVFASRARLLQSIWRTEKSFDFEKYGNFLVEDFAKELSKIQLIGGGLVTPEIYTLLTVFINNNLDKLISPAEIMTNGDFDDVKERLKVSYPQVLFLLKS